MDKNVFAKRLTAIRKERNVSVQEMAQALDVHKTTIHRYEAAKINKINSGTVKVIAEYLNVNPDYLMGVSDCKYAAKVAEDLPLDITDKEKTLLDWFRQVPAERQQMVLDMIKIALKASR